MCVCVCERVVTGQSINGNRRLAALMPHQLEVSVFLFACIHFLNLSEVRLEVKWKPCQDFSLSWCQTDSEKSRKSFIFHTENQALCGWFFLDVLAAVRPSKQGFIPIEL